MSKFATDWPGGTEGAKPFAQDRPGASTEGLDEVWPVLGPVHGLHQLTR
jgi:hypothetical protein